MDVLDSTDPRRTVPHKLAMHEGLHKIIAQAFEEASIPLAECEVADRGDGVLIFVPLGFPQSRIAHQLLERIHVGLLRHNEVYSEEARIQLRLAVHAGDVYFDTNGQVGPDIEFTCRILEADDATQTLRASGGPLAVIASEMFYQSVIARDPGTALRLYRQIGVAVKSTRDVAWLRVFGSTATQSDNSPANMADTAGLSVNERFVLLKAVANTFEQPEAAERLMIMMRYPIARRPNFTTDANQAWNAVFNDIDNGLAGPATYVTLLKTTLRIYRAHPVLRPLAERHGLVETRDDPGREPQKQCSVIIRANTQDEREHAEMRLRELDLNPDEQWSTSSAVSYKVSSGDSHALREQLEQTGLGWIIVAPGEPNYLYERLYVEGPDGRRFALRDAPVHETIGNLAREILTNQYPGQNADPIVVDLVGPGGQTTPVNSDATMHDAQVHDGDTLRLGYQATAGGLKPVRVFISYAHDPENESHGTVVRRFWEFLRSCGISAELDLIAGQQRQDWALWMGDRIRNADYVLVVASLLYRERAEGRGSPGKGRGVQWEARLIRDAFYTHQDDLNRFIPVVLPGQTTDGVPDFLAPATTTVYHVSDFTISGMDPLLRLLTGQPDIVDVPLGAIPLLPIQAATVGADGSRWPAQPRPAAPDATTIEALNSHTVAAMICEAVQDQESLKEAALQLAAVQGDVTADVVGALLPQHEGLVIRLLAELNGQRTRSIVAAVEPERAWLTGLSAAAAAIPRCQQEFYEELGNRVGDLCRAGETGFRLEFEHGRIHWSLAGGAQATFGVIDHYHRSHQDELGFPMAAPEFGDGRVHQLFEDAVVYWSEKTGTHATWGGIGRHHRSVDGLGLPVSDEQSAKSHRKTTGWFQIFEHGAISFTPKGGAISVPQAIAAYWIDHGGPSGHRGFAVEAAAPLTSRYGTQGVGQLFESSANDNEAVIYCSKFGAYTVHHGVRARYESLDGISGLLGFPLSDEIDARPGPDFSERYVQHFEGGSIFWSWQHAALARSTEIGHTVRGHESVGLPVGKPQPIAGESGTWIQFFERGVVTIRHGGAELWIPPDA